MVFHLFFSLIVCFMLMGCSTSISTSDHEPVTIFAAASTTDAVTEIVNQFSEKSGIEVNTNFGSWSVLAT